MYILPLKQMFLRKLSKKMKKKKTGFLQCIWATTSMQAMMTCLRHLQ